MIGIGQDDCTEKNQVLNVNNVNIFILSLSFLLKKETIRARLLHCVGKTKVRGE